MATDNTSRNTADRTASCFAAETLTSSVDR